MSQAGIVETLRGFNVLVGTIRLYIDHMGEYSDCTPNLVTSSLPTAMIAHQNSASGCDARSAAKELLRMKCGQLWPRGFTPYGSSPALYPRLLKPDIEDRAGPLLGYSMDVI